jgi:Carboxypeptidase regulatory-like domain/FG-GAP-like repeat
MNWKFKLSLLLVAVLLVIALFNLPSQSSTEEEKNSFSQGKVTKYENGVMKMEPQNFAVSGAVRDMPKTDPNALINRANFVSQEERRERLLQRSSKDGSFLSQVFGDDEINELNAERIKKVVPGAGAGYDDFLDPLLNKSQKSYAPETMPTPSLTFDGASSADNIIQGFSNITPPDTNGDVGPNHYVSSVNLVLKMFNKSGAVVAGPIKTSLLFASLPANDPCRTNDSGDPIVLYDSLADRWHVSQFALPSGNLTYQCVAVSVTGDPTGSYYVWSYGYPIQAFNDYPKVGVWTDAYHMTFNQFGITGGYLGVGILSQDRAKALAGDPTAGAVYVNIGALDQNTGGTLPGDIDGFVAPPVGMAEVIGEYRADEFGDPVDGVRMYKWVPNFLNPGNSTLTILGDVALARFDGRQPPGANEIEVLGAAPNQYLDSLADRSMHRFAYRNFGTTANPINSYVGNFSVNVSGVPPTSADTYQTGIRWFEMRRTNDAFSVFDQGTHNLTPGNGATGLNNWMGSIAQDNRGDIALGFSQAGTTQLADIKIAGRTNNVQNSGTLNEGETLFYPAGGKQLSTRGRWGDYSAMSVDPSDDCTFWYTQEYYAADSTAGWSTRVGKFRYPQCTDAPKATIQGTITFCDTGAPVDKASIGATGGFNRVTGTNGTYSMTVSPGNYTVGVAKFGGFTSVSSQDVTVANGQTATANLCLNRVAAVTSGTPQITAESCGVANNTPDPGEQITISLPLQNTGAASTSNLTATLQTTGAVTNPSGTQNYGAIAPGASASRNFTFKVDPTIGCGTTVTLTFNVSDGTTNYGTVTQPYTTGVPTLTFSENFDTVTPPALPANWTNVQLLVSPPANCTEPGNCSINWLTTTTVPNSAPNSAFANEPTVPNTSALVSPAIQIQQANAQISFKNWYFTEETFDGMVLEFSTNNGTSWTDVITGGGSFVSGGYNTIISNSTDSTIKGRRAWSGISGVGTAPVYIDTVVNLPASLNGQSVKFRWVFATDTGTAKTGVHVDDVKIFGARQCNTCPVVTACKAKRRYDFDINGKDDLSIYRPSTGVWYILNPDLSYSTAQLGDANDKLVPADYDGDGKIDIAVWRPSTGIWYLLRSTAGFTAIQLGNSADIPQPADFNGDGRADLAVFRPSTGTWYVLNDQTNQYGTVQFGAPGDKPIVGDYDGDGKADYAVYRPSSGIWYVLQSTNGFFAVQFGISTDKPVVGDYDGDCKSDFAVYRPSEGNWYILRSMQGFTGVQFGNSTDLPVPADYDGDGKTDVAVFRPDTNIWYQLPSSQTGFSAFQFGANGDRPVPNAFVP